MECARRKECLNHESVCTRCKNFDEYVQKRNLMVIDSYYKGLGLVIRTDEKDYEIKIPMVVVIVLIVIFTAGITYLLRR